MRYRREKVKLFNFSDIIKKNLIEDNTPQEIPWQIIERCYLFLDKSKYLHILKNNAGINTQNNSWEWALEARAKTISTPPDTILEYRNNLQDNINIFYPVCTKNKELLEVYSLQILIEKRIDEMPQIVERYKTLNYEKLPQYIEEANDILTGKLTAKNIKKNSYAEYYYGQ